MARPRIYCSGEISAGRIVELSGNAANHVSRVLRLEPGDPLIVFNGEGGEFRATIEWTRRDRAAVAIEEHLGVERETPLSITLAQAVCAGEKMDWIVQKAVELGVSQIQVLDTRRGTPKLSEERAERRAAHWRHIAISACEQCGRNKIPEIFPLMPLGNWLGSKKRGLDIAERDGRNLRFMMSPAAGEGLAGFTESSPVSSVIFLIGPEGGLTQDEEAAAAIAGFVPLRLGPRILRTETAGLAAVAAAQALWGDFLTTPVFSSDGAER